MRRDDCAHCGTDEAPLFYVPDVGYCCAPCADQLDDEPESSSMPGRTGLGNSVLLSHRPGGETCWDMQRIRERLGIPEPTATDKARGQAA